MTTCIVRDCGAKQTFITHFCKSHEITWTASAERREVEWKTPSNYEEMVQRFATRIHAEELVVEDDLE